MTEAEIVSLNIERYRRLLQSESDATVRRTIERLLGEAEANLRLLANVRPARREN